MSDLDDLADLYAAGNYWYGGYHHVTDIKDDPAWNLAGILGDGVTFVQSGAQAAGSHAAATATTAAGAAEATEFVEGAATPIIEAGLWVLLGMTTSSGFGTPDRGQDFGSGAHAFDQIRTSLEATGSPASWTGDGATAYDGQNVRQKDRAQTMSATDGTITKILDGEGADVEDLRGYIDRRTTALTLFIPAAIAAKLIPGAGLAISAGIELAAVAGTVPLATTRFMELAAKTVDNAHRVVDLAAEYDRIGTEPDPDLPGGVAAVTVGSADLHGLSNSQDQLATNAVVAGRTTEETAWNVGISHGLVCAPNTVAVTTAVAARTAAAARMRAVSSDLAAKLVAAAAEYDATDSWQGRNLDGEMPPR